MRYNDKYLKLCFTEAHMNNDFTKGSESGEQLQTAMMKVCGEWEEFQRHCTVVHGKPCWQASR